MIGFGNEDAHSVKEFSRMSGQCGVHSTEKVISKVNVCRNSLTNEALCYAISSFVTFQGYL